MTTGRRTTWQVDVRRPMTSTGTMVPTASCVSNGVVTAARRVDTVVMPTLRATSARARKETMLLAVPPGQQATRTSPTAKAFGSPAKCARPAPIDGMTVYWSKTPKPMVHGVWRRRLKSSASRHVPIPIIVSARPQTTQSPLNQRNQAGFISPRIAPDTTHRGNICEATEAQRDSLSSSPPGGCSELWADETQAAFWLQAEHHTVVRIGCTGRKPVPSIAPPPSPPPALQL
mmetsp:Transcript_5925/g.16591  ORF Transcript_5925/g.16591 Transcript_5925/m.16591 type:complete len:231 (-) Transcript_5925:405-1097(-)